jgi:hypothetical protein
MSAAGSPGTPDRSVEGRPPRTERWVFLGVLLGLLVFIFVPIAAMFARGQLFGGDWGQYVLTSGLYLHPQSNMLSYPEPFLPLLYVPVTAVFGYGVAAGYVADFLSGVLLIAIYLGAYRVFRELTGSSYSGILGALLLTTAPLVLDEVGWAGQAQFLALVLGLATTWVLLRKVLADGRYWWALVAGLLLALAVLTEAYTTLYFLMVLLVFLLLAFHRELLERRTIEVLAATFVTPIVAVIVLARANAGLTGNVLAQPILARAGYLPMYKALYLRFVFDSWILLVLYPSILLAYGLLWRHLEYSRPTYKWLVPALLVAWVPQFLLFTPVVDTDRALYFAFLPAAAMIALIARALPGVWRGAVARAPTHVYTTRWGQVPRGRRLIVPTIALVALLTVGAQAGVASHTFYGSLTYYGYDSGVLSELNVLDSKNGSLLLVTPDLGTFAAAWASGRNAFFGPPSQPATFTRSNQQQAVIDGNLLSYGASWVGAGNTWAVDAEPYWGDPAPLILQYQGTYLFQSLEMNDSSQWVAFSSNATPGVVENVSLFSAPSITHTVNPEDLTTTYNWSGLSVTKTIASDGEGNITVAFRYHCEDSVLRGAGLSLVLPNPRRTIETTYAAALPSRLWVSQILKNGFLPFAFGNTVGVTAPGATGSTQYLAKNSSSDGRIVSVLSPGPATSTELAATISIAPVDLSSPPATVTDERTVLAANDISWVAVERSMGVRFLERFLEDPEFTLYASTPHYLIFETNWN